LKTLACIVQNNIDEFTLNVQEEDEDILDDIKTPFSLVVSLGTTAIGAISLLYAKKNSDRLYQVYKAEVLQPLVFNGGLPKLELIKKLEKEAWSKLEQKD